MTLTGDVYDLQGTMEGGAPSSQSSVLASISELHTVKSELDSKKAELDAVTSELASLSKVCAQWLHLRWVPCCHCCSVMLAVHARVHYHEWTSRIEAARVIVAGTTPC